MKKIFFIFFCFQSLVGFCQTNILCDSIETKEDSLLYHNDTIFTGNYYCYDKEKLTGIGYVTNGIMDSISLFNNKGDLIQQTFYKNKTEYSVILYINGVFTKFVQTFNNNHQLDGLWEELTLDGKLLARRYYKDGKPVGHWVTYNRKGNLMYETYFDENPSVFKVYVYKNFFKKNKDTLLVNIQYFDKKRKLLKKEKITISKEEYLKLCR